MTISMTTNYNDNDNDNNNGKDNGLFESDLVPNIQGEI